MSLVRAFLAVDLDGTFLDEVAALAARLRGASRPPGARWVAADAMHVTLRFFGNADEAQVAVLRSLVTELGAGATSSILRATSVIGFPKPKRAHVLVLDLDDGGVLAAMAARAEAAAVALGFEPGARAYRPHLTLARMRRPTDVLTLADEAASLPPARVTAITLYASTTTEAGPIYSPLERVTLPEP